MVEQWLESPQPQQQFVAPNLLLELRHRGGAGAAGDTRSGPASSRIRRFDFAARHTGRDAGRAARAAWQRRVGAWLRQQIELAESTQAGSPPPPRSPPTAARVAPPLAQFRATVGALLRAVEAAGS